MAQVKLAPLAEQDIDEVCDYTRGKWGERKEDEYIELIGLAYGALEENPRAGRERPDILPSVWLYHVARPGRGARHFLLYRITAEGNVEIGRFLYDGMDIQRHVPGDWKP